VQSPGSIGITSGIELDPFAAETPDRPLPFCLVTRPADYRSVVREHAVCVWERMIIRGRARDHAGSGLVAGVDGCRDVAVGRPLAGRYKRGHVRVRARLCAARTAISAVFVQAFTLTGEARVGHVEDRLAHKRKQLVRRLEYHQASVGNVLDDPSHVGSPIRCRIIGGHPDPNHERIHVSQDDPAPCGCG
jgi:hypothetical protein